MKQPNYDNNSSRAIMLANYILKEYDNNTPIINICDQCFKEGNLLVCEICKQYFHKECVESFKITQDTLRCVKCKQFNSSSISHKKNNDNVIQELNKNNLLKTKSNVSIKEKDTSKEKSKEKIIQLQTQSQLVNKGKNKFSSTGFITPNNNQNNDNNFSESFMERNFNVSNKENIKQMLNLNENNQLLKQGSSVSINDNNNSSLLLKEESFKLDKRSESFSKDKGNIFVLLRFKP